MPDCVKLGDDVTLYLGDCLEVLPGLEAQSIDAILTDLPYGTTACSWDEIIPFGPMWKEVKRLLKPRGVFVTTASQPFTSKLVMSNPGWFRYEWIWEKDRPTGAGNASKRPLKSHENVLVFSENGNTYNPQKTTGHQPIHNHGKNSRPPEAGTFTKTGNGGATDRYPRSVQKVCVPNHGEMGLHPTQKPVALYEYLTRTYTNPGDTILDFCMGSGTTGCAAVNIGRRFVGVELREDYFAIAERRIRDAQRQMVMQL